MGGGVTKFWFGKQLPHFTLEQWLKRFPEHSIPSFFFLLTCKYHTWLFYSPQGEIFVPFSHGILLLTWKNNLVLWLYVLSCSEKWQNAKCKNTLVQITRTTYNPLLCLLIHWDFLQWELVQKLSSHFFLALGHNETEKGEPLYINGPITHDTASCSQFIPDLSTSKLEAIEMAYKSTNHKKKFVVVSN